MSTWIFLSKEGPLLRTRVVKPPEQRVLTRNPTMVITQKMPLGNKLICNEIPLTSIVVSAELYQR